MCPERFEILFQKNGLGGEDWERKTKRNFIASCKQQAARSINMFNPEKLFTNVSLCGYLSLKSSQSSRKKGQPTNGITIFGKEKNHKSCPSLEPANPIAQTHKTPTPRPRRKLQCKSTQFFLAQSPSLHHSSGDDGLSAGGASVDITGSKS